MSDSLEQLKALLKYHGYSLSRPRKRVFETLQHHEPQTMHQLVVACPDIDRASVYRTVALFERLGIAQRLQIGWKYKLELSDDFQHHHHHFTCVQCGNVAPLKEDQALERRLAQLAHAHSFAMESHQLEIQGSCSSCAVQTKVALHAST